VRLRCAQACATCGLVLSAALIAQGPVVTRTIELTLTEGTAMAAAASPDRKWIAIDLVGGIWVLPFDGGEARRLTPDTVEARQPTWAPDNNRIAFQGFGDDGVWHIYTVRRDGGASQTPKALTSGIFDDREPIWSHDGRRIAFSSDRWGGISTIWTLIVPTGDVQRVSENDGWTPTWAPDDHAIAWLCARRGPPPQQRAYTSICTADGSGAPREVGGMGPASPPSRAVAWSPDGSRFALTDSDSVSIVSGNGPSARPFQEDVSPFRAQWLSEGEILYTADGAIKRRTLGAGRSRAIPFSARVSLQRDTYEIAHRPLEPSGPQAVRGIVSPVVAPNGRAVAFVALGDVWVAPLSETSPPVAGAPMRITDDEAAELDPAWSPDSTRLAFASDRDGRLQIWIHDFRTHTETRVTEGHDAATRPAWSPDGNHLAWIANERVEFRDLVRDEHRGAIANAIVRGTLGSPTWSYDNHTIGVGSLFPFSERFADGLNQLLLFRLDPEGAFSTALVAGRSAGNRESGGPVWAPDGTRMTYAGEGKLWNVNVDMMGGATSPPSAIAPSVQGGDELPESPSWEGDTRHLLYQTPSGLRRIPADGGVPENIAIAMTWSPDVAQDGVVVHAGHMIDGVVEGIRGETDIVVDRTGVIREISGHRDELHAGRVVLAPDETVMPGLIDMRASVDRAYGSRFGRVLLAYGVTTVRIPGMNAYAAIAE